MNKIFIVEDDPGIINGLTSLLQKYGYTTEYTKKFTEILSDFRNFNPDLVLMDIKLPFMDGYHWTREIRKESGVPIIFLSSVSDKMNMVMAMQMGADDFIPKPFDPELLIVKIQALLRRAYGYKEETEFNIKGATLKKGDYNLYYNDSTVDLTKNEYSILLTLMENEGKVVSRGKLIETLWDDESFIDDNTLTVNINRLRKKLKAIGLDDFIETKFGEGYKV